MEPRKVELSTAQKVLIALLIAAGLVALAYFLYMWGWTQPPCPTCHIERNSPLSGARSDIGCVITGRIDEEFTEGPLVAELGGIKAVDIADQKAPVSGYLKNDCVNIPVPCPPAATPELQFSLMGQADVRWDNPLCKGDATACPPCKE